MLLLRRYAATRPSPAYIGVSGEEVSSANRHEPRDKLARGGSCREYPRVDPRGDQATADGLALRVRSLNLRHSFHSFYSSDGLSSQVFDLTCKTGHQLKWLFYYVRIS